MIYFWQECKIHEQYGDSAIYFCNSEVASIPGIGQRLSNPSMFLLYAPLATGITLAVVRKYRRKMSALNARRGVIALTGLTFGVSILIIFGALFVNADNEFYRDKQCYLGDTSSDWMQYCLKGTERANLSGFLMPIEIALGAIAIALAILYRNEY